MWLSCDILDWKLWWLVYIDMLEIAWGWITWIWTDGLSSMRLCVKCDFCVEYGYGADTLV
jgi:hypothetical protein